METLLELLAYGLKITGVVFLLIAAVGVLRLPDAFTRMHAATKAGTLGAGLVVAGSALSLTGAEAVGLALVTMIVLLATVPLASHLLARAAYTSGAPFWAGTARDALKGTLARGDTPGREEAAPPNAPAEPFVITRVLAAPSHGAEGRAARTASRVADSLGVPLALAGLIDARPLKETGLALARERLEAVLGRALERAPTGAGIEMREGVPQDALTALHRPGDLTILPPAGWYDHEVAGPEAWAEAFGIGRGESILPLAQALPRPVLLAGDEDAVAHIVVLDDGSDAILRALATLAARPPFPGAKLRVTWDAAAPPLDARRAALEEAARGSDFGIQAPVGVAGTVRNPGDLLVCHALPGPARGDWYGADWRDRIAPGWRGAVLLV